MQNQYVKLVERNLLDEEIQQMMVEGDLFDVINRYVFPTIAKGVETFAKAFEKKEVKSKTYAKLEQFKTHKYYPMAKKALEEKDFTLFLALYNSMKDQKDTGKEDPRGL
jgi:hypothetical protein